MCAFIPLALLIAIAASARARVRRICSRAWALADLGLSCIKMIASAGAVAHAPKCPSRIFCSAMRRAASLAEESILSDGNLRPHHSPVRMVIALSFASCSFACHRPAAPVPAFIPPALCFRLAVVAFARVHGCSSPDAAECSSSGGHLFIMAAELDLLFRILYFFY